MIKKIVMIIGFLFIAAPVSGKPINPPELNECIYSYWAARVGGAVVDAHAAYKTSVAANLPLITGNFTAGNDFIANPPPAFIPSGPYLALTQQLVNVSNWADNHAKHVSEKAAQLDFEDQLLTLMKTATTAFYDEIQKANTVKLLQQRVPRLVRAITLAQETARLHLEDASSYYWAQADKEALDISIAGGQSDAVTALNLIKASIGLGDGSLELDENYDPQINADLSYWSRKIDELPTIQVLKARAEASGAEAISAHDQIFPTASLGATYGRDIAVNPGGPSAALTLTLTVPIFDQGIRNIQTQQNESQKTIFEAQILSTKEAQLAAVKNLLVQIQADDKSLKLAKDQLGHNRQGYNATVTLFSFGKTSFVAIRDSESSLVSAEIQLETIKSKIAGERATLELLGDYSAGRHHWGATKVKCPVR